jgi:uncharacterized membrane protein YebE (DUF533 family)
MTDLNKIVDGLMKSGVLGGLAGGVAGGALTGLLGGKGAKKLGKTALQAGVLAAVGGLAWKAYQTYASKSGATAQPAPGSTAPALPAPSHELLMVRAMIAAAHADGHLDAREQARIFEQVDRMGLAADDKALLFDELRRPLGLLELVELTPDTEAGAEVYAASLLAIDPSQPVSQRYLEELARRLQLPPELVRAVQAEVESAASEERLRS